MSLRISGGAKVPGRLRVGRGAVGQAGDDGQVVADDVVHFAGDPGAFGEGGQLKQTLAFGLQACPAVGHRAELGLAHPDHQGDGEGGGSHPRVQDEQAAPGPAP